MDPNPMLKSPTELAELLNNQATPQPRKLGGWKLHCGRLYVDPMGRHPRKGEAGVVSLPHLLSMKATVNKALADRRIASEQAHAELKVLGMIEKQLITMKENQSPELQGEPEVAIMMGSLYPLKSPSEERRSQRRRAKASRRKNRPKKKRRR